MKVLFITRKHPPQIGGMESLSYGLITNFPCDSDAIILNKKQINLIWFIPYALIKALLVSSQYDVVHIGDPVLSIIGYCIKRFRGIPVVATIHGLDVTYNNRFYQMYIKIFMKLDRFICISQRTAEEAKKRGFSDTTIIPVGVDCRKFNKNHDRFNTNDIVKLDLNKKRILVTVGRLIKRKGVYWFIESVLPRLNENIAYLVVGCGSDHDRIKGLIEKMGYENKVHLLGCVSEDALGSIYKAADLFVMPNIPIDGDMEGFGIVALEAASVGLPVVATNIEGIKDAIKDGQNGFLVDQYDVDGFVGKISELLDNDQYRERVSLHMKQYVNNQYGWSYIHSRYMEVFQRVCGNSK